MDSPKNEKSPTRLEILTDRAIKVIVVTNSLLNIAKILNIIP